MCAERTRFYYIIIISKPVALFIIYYIMYQLRVPTVFYVVVVVVVVVIKCHHCHCSRTCRLIIIVSDFKMYNNITDTKYAKLHLQWDLRAINVTILCCVQFYNLLRKTFKKCTNILYNDIMLLCTLYITKLRRIHSTFVLLAINLHPNVTYIPSTNSSYDLFILSFRQ